MKIGIVCYPTYGGSGVLATELGKELACRGHEIHFITYDVPMRLEGYVENVFYHEVETATYPLFEFSMYPLAVASKMVEVVKYQDLDILHVHYAIPHATSAVMAKQILKDHPVKIITTLHGTDITLVGLEPTFLPLMRYSIEQSDGVTAVSRFLREKTISQYGVEKDIAVIYNFVDTEKYKRIDASQWRSRFSKQNEKVLVHVSNFRPVKRVPDVIRIFAEVRKQVPSHLLLVGDGPDRSECERLTRELGLANNVHFLGKQQGLVEIHSSADLMLMPSQSESFGLSALEAMSCEVPVVSSSVGGLPELIVHGETGFIAEIGDIQRMAKYAIDLLTNDAKYKLFAKNSRKRAVEFFDAKKIIPQYEAYYATVMGKNGTSAAKVPAKSDSSAVRR
ncbi:MAG TPA: N-acetyl-alpha-D-glucosaminyl L-malate synthase BshA [Candidatus Kapabacteria bacterium]|nr:N-acetyl-alpha-D-glucosaminyl L-malate synthase BshA [Candidatus Kapabacteria bacterium]